ncbi:HtaA domain-containing protein [Streptomyces sp. NRRL F-5123]|uniref:HtaA domain-containing protein n=1 Tax=Streptomyces sp. NRRL F-5123 TaxID=1463856 RepID=UPI00099B58E9|nr:HtaA domain-containing protein [Streptomyces sp. NRRL F-5123]
MGPYPWQDCAPVSDAGNHAVRTGHHLPEDAPVPPGRGCGHRGVRPVPLPARAGSREPASGTPGAGCAGGVRFAGHERSDGVRRPDPAISRFPVRISGGGGTVYAYMSSKDKDTGKVAVSRQVPLARLAPGGVDTRGVAGTRPAPAGFRETLTAQGARAFAGYRTAGTATDPVGMSVALRQGVDLPARPGTGSDAAAPAAGTVPADATSADTTPPGAGSRAAAGPRGDSSPAASPLPATAAALTAPSKRLRVTRLRRRPRSAARRRAALRTQSRPSRRDPP